jgi:hypothetical protein
MRPKKRLRQKTPSNIAIERNSFSGAKWLCNHTFKMAILFLPGDIYSSFVCLNGFAIVCNFYSETFCASSPRLFVCICIFLQKGKKMVPTPRLPQLMEFHYFGEKAEEMVEHHHHT